MEQMDPKREEKHRIRANFGQKRVGGGVNREQKQRATEGWENNGARVRSPLPVERTVKPWGTHGQNVLHSSERGEASQREGREHTDGKALIALKHGTVP
ncbi:hypothetical protein NPIL_612241 [Nephila pilipes]|uniref:Uncharacterized protein n=1 Tax=Nephila pilipes TaxID=299642 RepID=A0A8X6MJR6_NEPPI|nr:hypothetical protein NPIL_612241 [Nephila pilipes]